MKIYIKFLLVVVVLNTYLFANEQKCSSESKEYKVLVNKLYIRKYPSVNETVTGAYLKDEVLKSVAICEGRHKDGLWIKTKKGFSAKKYLQEVKNYVKKEKVKKETKKKTNKVNVVSNNVVNAKKTAKTTCLLNKYKLPKNYFIGASIGLSKMSVEKNGNTFVILSSQPDKSGINYNLELGYQYSKDIFSTVSYSLIRYNDIKLHNYLASYNKVLHDIEYKPYVGLVGGISYIQLTRSHINSTLPDTKGRRLAVGFQVGIEKEIEKDLVFFTQYQFLKAKHKTALKSGSNSDEFVRDNYSNLNFGIRKKF